MDHYALLEIAKHATQDEIKRAYKKQALKYHPDRNFDRVDEATAEFAKVQAAYDILSDKQERAWFDSHGPADSGPHSYDDEVAAGKVTTVEDLRRYFDPMLYQNTSDAPEGIYQIVSGIFGRLAQEEAEAVFDQGQDADYVKLPVFGNSNSNWVRETKVFYDAWLGFSSKKTFAWYDQYRMRDAPDRRTRRAMETHNQKVRDAAKREFNETVRTLISFIRKRDPRFKLRTKNASAAKISAKAQANAAAMDQATRDRKTNASKREGYEEQPWEKVEQEEFDAFVSDKGSSSDSDADAENASDEDVVNLFECVACDKLFKTQKQLGNHELSKKHVSAVQKLRWEMRKEGIELHIDDESSEEGSQEESSALDDISAKPANTKGSFSVLMSDSDSDSESETKPANTKGSFSALMSVSDSESESEGDAQRKVTTESVNQPKVKTETVKTPKVESESVKKPEVQTKSKPTTKSKPVNPPVQENTLHNTPPHAKKNEKPRRRAGNKGPKPIDEVKTTPNLTHNSDDDWSYNKKNKKNGKGRHR